MSRVKQAAMGSSLSATISSSSARLSAHQTGLFTPIPLTLLGQGAKTAILTNPTWGVKVRTFAASHNSRGTPVGPAGGFRAIFRYEVWGGLYRGTSLAQVGVSNSALQFMAYEKMKSWAFERKLRRIAKLGCV
ncbi:hypothetical protein BJY52DRAFT_1352877 [Lactarius psammicola]|nr:hypothetical protein BJY52DRAFT_1352877 [Lactarius psammicola]